MSYREFQQDQNIDLGNSSVPDFQIPYGNICPYTGAECLYREDLGDGLNPDEMRQRLRPRPYFYHRPHFYPYHRPHFYPYHRPYYYPFYSPYFLPYYMWDFDEDYD